MIAGKIKGTITTDGATQFFDKLVDGEMLNMSDDAVMMLVGDANARVSVSMDMSDKHFGSGFGVNVSVSLSCNQDAETLRDASGVAQALAEEFVQEAFLVAKSAYAWAGK